MAVGFLIVANEKDQVNNISVTQNFMKIDLGISFGSSTKIEEFGLGFGISYYTGLSTIFVNNSRIKNGLFEIFA